MIGTTILTQFIIPALIAIITAWTGWYFGKKKTQGELDTQDLNNDAIEIDNLRKTMDSLTERLTKEIERLTERVNQLEKKLEQKENIVESKRTIISHAFNCKYASECPVIKKQSETNI